jgi:hypothetical protein
MKNLPKKVKERKIQKSEVTVCFVKWSDKNVLIWTYHSADVQTITGGGEPVCVCV